MKDVNNFQKRLNHFFDSKGWPLCICIAVNSVPYGTGEPELDATRWILALNSPNIPIPIMSVQSGKTVLECAEFFFARPNRTPEEIYSSLRAFSHMAGTELASQEWKPEDILAYILTRLTGTSLKEAKKETKALEILSGCTYSDKSTSAEEFFVAALKMEKELPAFAAYVAQQDDSIIKRMLRNN
jgi:hypothetical protein